MHIMDKQQLTHSIHYFRQPDQTGAVPHHKVGTMMQLHYKV